jgi:hypothetical protein
MVGITTVEVGALGISTFGGAPLDTLALGTGPLDGGVLPAAVSVDLPVVAGAITALIGLFVAYQAYRGYRRNFSKPMGYLAVGILFVTTVSFVVPQIIVGATGVSDAAAILIMTTLDVVGLSAILYALTDA